MKQFNHETIEESILGVLKYFSFFNYPPTAEEIHTFLKKKARKQQITSILKKMEEKSVVKSWRLDDRGLRIEGGSLRMKDRRWKEKQKFFLSSIFYHLSSTVNTSRYTLSQYNNLAIKQFSNFAKRYKISKNKLTFWKFTLYIKMLSFFPQIKLIGLSGSVAMLNAGEDHDIDLFIITTKNRLFTARFITLSLAQILGLRRKRHSGKQLSDSEGARPESLSDSGVTRLNRRVPQNDNNNITIQQYNNFSRDKVCLNLFFDESNLKIPKFKRSDYVAHEVLQMKPLVQKDNVYLRFIDTNRWVFDIFPNAKPVSSIKYKVSGIKKPKTTFITFLILNTNYLILNTITDKFEQLLKSLQLWLINKHRTTEIITSTQLWFHPEDFSQKIKTSKIL